MDKDKQEKRFLPRVVCAALQRRSDGLVICGPRHFDPTMRALIDPLGGPVMWRGAIHGFVDQYGEFLTREQALARAEARGQIIEKHHPLDQLCSEDIY